MSARDRFSEPAIGAAATVTLPPIERSTLPNGLRIWSISQPSLPVAALSLIMKTGTVDDPTDLPGLGAITADMLDEGAGGRDSIHIAEGLADLGASMDLSAGPDAVAAQLWSVRRHLPQALAVLADVFTRPHLADQDLTRVRELRLSRLQQLRRSAASAADRAFSAAVFGAHGYGHSGLGTSASIARITIEDVRAHHARRYGPAQATLIAVGDVAHQDIVAMAGELFGQWQSSATSAPASTVQVPAPGAPRVLFVSREGAPQSELRIGHVSVARSTPNYHALVLLNAGLGGSFSGRLNQRLRQQLGYTYGARSAFDMDRVSGSFSCDTSVQGDKTAESVREIHAMLAAIRSTLPLSDDELELARGSLTRGYARSFETPRQLVGALAQLAVHALPDDEFDTFVPKMLAVDAASVHEAARVHLLPDHLVTVVVGDAQWRDALAETGIPVETVAPEF